MNMKLIFKINYKLIWKAIFRDKSNGKQLINKNKKDFTNQMILILKSYNLLKLK